MNETTRVTNLRCEYLCNPVGIDETRPRFCWLLETDRHGARQAAYQVRVASNPELLAKHTADLWDSGRVESDATSQISYAGVPLRSRAQCHWQVTVWDETGGQVTSAPALWSMGLLQRDDWQARWITHDEEIIRRDPGASASTQTQPGTPPLMRKLFSAATAVQRATLYATARGICELRLNGQKVTNDCFLPEWTDYNKRLHYRAFDVTELVNEGENVLGAILGDGWWSGYVGWQETRGQYGTLENSLLAQLEIELASGETLVVVSDASWRCDTGPILCGDFMMGETYDARREQEGWDRRDFDDFSWLPVVEVKPPHVNIPQYGFSNNQAADTDDELPLVSQSNEPVRVVETIRPISINEVARGTYIYNLGQNIAGWVELSICGPAGTRVQLRHGERLNPDGTLYTENLRRAAATDVYILKGRGTEVWHPRFTFHGFQYIELTGLDKPLPLEQLRGCVVMSSTEPAGQFECSHPLVNRLWQNALWGQKGNFISVPTDCPQRDERLGWMGDAQTFLRTATYNMDVAAFFTKWMVDVTDSQDVDGIFPDVAPRLREGDNFIGLDGLGGAAGWADAGIIIPWTIWRVYGDTRIVERHWDAMVRWLDWLERTNPTGIRCHQLGNNYGDWLCIPADTSFRTHSEMKTLLATAFWADDATKTAAMARALGKQADAERFATMASRVKAVFQDEWLSVDGHLKVDTQTAYLLALAFDLVPEEMRDPVAQHLVDNIAGLDWHLSTGFVGICHLNPILTLMGHADVAYRLLCNEDYPSWLYPILHGATTIWERWNGWTEEEGFFNPQMNSFNHYSLGSVSEWLYRHVAGIELDPVVPGFKRFIIKPYVDDRLSYAEGSYRSIHGTIESRWERTKDGLRLHVVVPPNTNARVYYPCAPDSTLLESGVPIAEVPMLRLRGHDGSATLLEVPAGHYEFSTA